MTYHEAIVLAEARQFEEWSRTASLMALLCNINRSKGSRAYSPADFHPMKQARPKGMSINKSNMAMIRKALGAKKPGGDDGKNGNS